ncbi:glycoside hydrolase family protein [Phenylobacterium soli]|uniref:Lysozyme n=1 Tax=Phenylobacterium soli TaxID=2170551 RepID=A0A328AJ59_9CAUL|nr:glycoside hydrolase family protein [Phenylobacterium soli]RAK54882.1 hypothetical protein DJ017_10265 [Phenylobacterium soli]
MAPKPFSSIDVPDEVWEANARAWRARQDAEADGGDGGLGDLQRLLQSPQEEGRRNDVYLDSRGLPTVGIGHLVKPADNLQVGQRITDAQVDAFFRQDGAEALRRAKEQADAAGIDDPDFTRRLAAVNFQLGAKKWPATFPKTWSLIQSGDYAGAAKELYNSKWAKQTQHRVDAFRDALLRLPPKHAP